MLAFWNFSSSPLTPSVCCFHTFPQVFEIYTLTLIFKLLLYLCGTHTSCCHHGLCPKEVCLSPRSKKRIQRQGKEASLKLSLGSDFRVFIDWSQGVNSHHHTKHCIASVLPLPQQMMGRGDSCRNSS